MPGGSSQRTRFIVAIPARLESTRLPGKVLADVGGRPLLQHVLDAASAARRVAKVLVCTDNEQVADLARRCGVEVLMTSASCTSGTDRIASAIDAIDGEVIVNVQADQPFLRGATLDRLCERWLELEPPPEVLTPIYPLAPADVEAPSVVKVVVRADGRALYFSRAAVPHVTEQDARPPRWGHLGVYAFRRRVLERWPGLGPSPLEQAERLEQLRLLEHGLEIHTLPLELDARERLSVDVPADLDHARTLIAEDPS